MFAPISFLIMNSKKKERMMMSFFFFVERAGMMSSCTLVRNKTSVVGQFLHFLIMHGDLRETGREGLGISARWEGRNGDL